jgi:hypothetical protein
MLTVFGPAAQEVIPVRHKLAEFTLLSNRNYRPDAETPPCWLGENSLGTRLWHV